MVDIVDILSVEFEELQEARVDVGLVESSAQLWLLLLLLSLLFVSGFEMATGPLGNSTSSTRTVPPEALCRGEGNSLGRGEAFSSGCSLGAATYAGDRLQQNQLYPFSSPILFFLSD